MITNDNFLDEIRSAIKTIQTRSFKPTTNGLLIAQEDYFYMCAIIEAEEYIEKHGELKY